MAVGVQRRPAPASGTLTFLFTDIEGSTRLWEQHQHAMKEALERHDAILRAAVEGSGGEVVKTIGDGLMAVFDSAVEGLHASLTAQHALIDEPWGETGPLRVRMGLHAGEAAVREGDYFGPTLNRTARLMSAGHGGQVLLSAAAAALVVDSLPDGATLQDLGEHQLKGLGRPERVYQLSYPGLPASFPPGHTQATAAVYPTSRRPSWEGDGAGRDRGVSRGRVGAASDVDRTRRHRQDATLAVRRQQGDRSVRARCVLRRSCRGSRTRNPCSPRSQTRSAWSDGRQSLLDELRERLRDEHVLLINFEQVTQGGVRSLLLWDCPRLKYW